MQDELFTSRVPRSLETKTKLFGFEIGDLLLVFIQLSVLNLLFGSSRFHYPAVWGSTAGLLSLIFFVKKGKPDNFIQHAIEHHLRPPVLIANASDQKAKPFTKYQGEKYV